MIITEVDPKSDLRNKQRKRNQKAIDLLAIWIEEGDELEQRDTFEALKQGLNKHHSSGRAIYP